MALYTVTDTELTSIANAIRAKGGTSASLVYPSGFISAIGDIPSSGGAEDEIVARTISGVYENPRVSRIGNNAFQGCSSLTYVSIPSCTYIGYNAFALCSSLTSVSAPECLEIMGGAFSSCGNLTTAEFSKCTLIGNSTFHSCSKLVSISFPECLSMSIEAFYYCQSLTRAEFSKCLNVGSRAFISCYSLNAAIFPSCQTIYSSAFYNCSNLSTISFPECISIGPGAFYGCRSYLSQALFPKCTSMSSQVFYGCQALTIASFPVVTAVGSQAFLGCRSLSTALLGPCSIIWSFAFRDCYNLISLYLLGSSVTKLIDVGVFSSSPISTYSASAGRYGSIFVRASLLASWQAASNWSYFSSRFVGLTDAEIADLDVGNRIVTFSIDQYQNLNCVNINEFIEWGDNGLPVTFYDSYNDFTFVFDDYLDSTGTGEIGFYFDLLKGGELDYSFSKTVGGRTINYTLSSFMDGDNLLVWMNYS